MVAIPSSWRVSALPVTYLQFYSLILSSLVASESREAEKARHIAAGKELLAKGQFADALTHLHAAIEIDPKDYQLRYRRATALLATGKSKQALPDLDEVVKLKPDFISARIQRGNVLLKQGDLQYAEEDFRAALKVEPDNSEVKEKLQHTLDARSFVEQAKTHMDDNDLQSAEWYLNKALEFCQWDASLYRMRSKCLEARGEIRKAIADLRTLSKLLPDATDAFFASSSLYYNIGDVEESLGQIRECLKLNPDHKECFPFYKKVKKLAKMRESLLEFEQQSKWMECLDKGQQILKFEKAIPAIQIEVFRHTCKCNREAGHIKEALAECTEVLEHSDPNDVDMLCERAETFLVNEQYDEAIEDFRKAKSINEEFRRAREGLDRAEKMKKQASKRDYYKILGVKRNANKREIMKAYRKLAQKWHPDNFSDETEKKKAEQKFIEIAAAKEVLSDEEKRRKFDMGEDPLDPEAQQGGHGNPFHHGFHGFQGGFPFGAGGDGGPFSFKFHWG